MKGGNCTGNKKVVICSLSSKYVHSPLAPWCLAAGLREFGNKNIEYKIVEGTINEPIEKVAERIAAENPDIIGLSCYIWNIRSVSVLGGMLKSDFPGAKIILGGQEVSYNSSEVLSIYSWCDFVISGEGEYPFAALCAAIAGDGNFDIPGVFRRNGSEIIESEPYIGEGEPPSPYCKEYFDALRGRIAYLETSRGCPYSCAFCLSGRCGGVRFFDIERAKREMLALAKSGTQTVKLVDRTFNAHKERAKDLWRFIIAEHGKGIPENVCFHFEIAGDILDEEAIEILGSAPKGSIQLEIGLQSFNEKTLEYINRKTNTEKLKANIKKLVAPGNIHIHIDLIAGLPFEDINSFGESFNTAYSLRPNMLQLGFLKLLHGAAMREIPEKYPCEFSKEPPYEVISTEWTGRKVLERLHGVEDALERLYNSGRFSGTLEYLLAVTGLTPFEIFDGFGNWVKEKADAFVSLDDYTALVYEYFSEVPGVNNSVLKDKMICDRIASNASGKLPAVLKVKNDNIKKIRLSIESVPENKRLPGVKRGFALLESESAAVFSDYVNKDPVTGRYALRKVYYFESEARIMVIREETEKDYREVENLTREAFWNVYCPGCVEHLVVHRLHSEGGAIPKLDLVIEEDGKIVANIIYAEAKVKDEHGASHTVAIFGPLSVLPEYQKKGYGSKLIEHTLEMAKEMGYPMVIITGSPEYYGRFGFESASKYGIYHRDFGKDADAPFFMVKVLDEEKSSKIKGEYSDPEYYLVTGEEADAFDADFPPKKKEVLPGQLH